jgi:hypothetical protein
MSDRYEFSDITVTIDGKPIEWFGDDIKIVPVEFVAVT